MRTSLAVVLALGTSTTPAVADFQSTAIDCLVSMEALRTLEPSSDPERTPGPGAWEGFRQADEYVTANMSNDLAMIIAIRLNAVLKALADAPKDKAAASLAAVVNRTCPDVLDATE